MAATVVPSPFHKKIIQLIEFTPALTEAKEKLDKAKQHLLFLKHQESRTFLSISEIEDFLKATKNIQISESELNEIQRRKIEIESSLLADFLLIPEFSLEYIYDKKDQLRPSRERYIIKLSEDKKSIILE